MAKKEKKLNRQTNNSSEKKQHRKPETEQIEPYLRYLCLFNTQ